MQTVSKSARFLATECVNSAPYKRGETKVQTFGEENCKTLRQFQRFGKEKCKLLRQYQRFGKEKSKLRILRQFQRYLGDVTSVYLSLSLCISLSLSHRAHNTGSASALPIIYIYIYYIYIFFFFLERKKEKSEKLPNGKSDQETCLDSNQGPFAYRANALPTEPQVTVRGEWSSNPT